MLTRLRPPMSGVVTTSTPPPAQCTRSSNHEFRRNHAAMSGRRCLTVARGPLYTYSFDVDT